MLSENTGAEMRAKRVILGAFLAKEGSKSGTFWLKRAAKIHLFAYRWGK
jgi:hypothetical protein